MDTKTVHQGITRNKDTSKFRLDFRIEGKRYRKTIEADTTLKPSVRIEQAYEELKRYKRHLLHSLGLQVNIDSTLDDYFNRLCEVKNWSPQRLHSLTLYYKRNIQKVLGSIRVIDIKPKHITDFNTTLQHIGLSERKKAYEILKPLMMVAIEDELIIHSPIKSTHIPKRNHLQEKKIILNAEVKYRLVHDTIMEVFRHQDAHRAIFLFGLSGRRINEILTLHWNDIDFQKRTYRVKAINSKIKADMVFALDQEIADIIEPYKSYVGRVFTIRSVKSFYITIREKTGIKEFTFHYMRNLLVSALASRGVSTTHLSSILGHVDTSTLRKYLTLQRIQSGTVTQEVRSQILASNTRMLKEAV